MECAVAVAATVEVPPQSTMLVESTAEGVAGGLWLLEETAAKELPVALASLPTFPGHTHHHIPRHSLIVTLITHVGFRHDPIVTAQVYYTEFEMNSHRRGDCVAGTVCVIGVCILTYVMSDVLCNCTYKS